MRKLIVPISYEFLAELLQAEEGVRCVAVHDDYACQTLRIQFEGVGPEHKEGDMIPEVVLSVGINYHDPKPCHDIIWPVYE